MTPNAVVKIIIQFLFFHLKPHKGVDYENDYTITWPNGTESQGSTKPALKKPIIMISY